MAPPDEPLDPRHEAIRKWYGERFATGAAPRYHPPYPTGRPGASGLGYDATLLDAAPPGQVGATFRARRPEGASAP